MSKYVIAVRRDARDTAPEDWQQRLCEIDGLTVHGSDNPHRVSVEASDAAIAEARNRLGDDFHIEEAILHKPLLG